MDDPTSLMLALDVARAFKNDERSPLQTARKLAAIVNPWRSWWTEMGGANGPLSTIYAANDEAIRLHWLGDEVERWHPDVRETKRRELREAEIRWHGLVKKSCDALLRYAEHV